MPCTIIERLQHKEEELMKTNMMFCGLTVKASDVRGIISKGLTVGSKTILTAFFVVDVKGRYNVLLGRDWIHANGCVLSTLHQCVVQWVSDEVKVVRADDTMNVALVETSGDLQDGGVRCLSRRDLAEFEYVSVGRDGFVPMNVW
jgi:hypothetical protein